MIGLSPAIEPFRHRLLLLPLVAASSGCGPGWCLLSHRGGVCSGGMAREPCEEGTAVCHIVNSPDCRSRPGPNRTHGGLQGS